MSFARIVLGFAALLFLLTGLAFLVRPEESADLVSIRLPAIVARSDVRAVYGGLEIALAGVFAVAAWKRTLVRAASAALVAVFAGLLLGRLVSIAVDGVPESPGLTLIGIEFAMLVIAGLAHDRASRGDPPEPDAGS